MRKTKLFLLLALLAFGQTAWAQQQFSGGTGTEADPYQLSSATDWNTFANNVKNGNSYSGKYFIMTNDFNVTTMVGSENKPFEGVFDGNGKTLGVEIMVTDHRSAPFRYVNNATIKRLCIGGYIIKEYDKVAEYVAGFAAKTSGTCFFISCRSNVYLAVNNDDQEGRTGYGAGFVSEITNGDVSFVNCVFDGSLSFYNANESGGFVATVSSGADVSFVNCLFAASALDNKNSRYCSTYVTQEKGDVVIYNSYYTKIADIPQGINAIGWSNSELIAALGSDWWYEYEYDYGYDLNKVEPRTSVDITSNSFSGSGTETDPYQIATVADWRKLALLSIMSKTSGKHYKLMNDLSLTETTDSNHPSKTMAGIGKNMCFQGIFDGNGHTLTVDYTDNGNEHYCAPFRIINGATIKNLHVTGTIRKENKKHAGGFVGQAYGTNHIVNCRSSADIQANTDGDGSHGGFLGDLRGGSTSFENCLFDGKLRGKNGGSSPTTKWSGFVGWVAEDREANFINCMFAPAEINISDKSKCRTFARRDEDNDVHFTRCYYTTALGNTDGKHARSISGSENVSVVAYGTAETGTNGVNGITVYKQNGNTNPCILYNDVLYSGSGDNVSIIPSQVGDTPEGLLSNSFIATPGSLSLMTDYYNLSMPNANVEITLAPSEWLGEGTADSPWLIQNTEHWNLLCSRVNDGTSTYSGKYFKLMADITVEETFSGTASKMVGSSESNCFKGTFDGNGHTLTINYTDQSDNEHCAPFRFINGATIKNLRVTGSILKSNQKYAGGLVGRAGGTNYITGCRSSVDICFTKSGDITSGGFVGHIEDNQSTNFTNCLFDGKLRGADADHWGGFVGWIDDNDRAYMTNCLFNPEQVSVKSGNNKDFARYDSGDAPILSNCYRKNSQLSGDQGTNASSYENAPLRTALGDGWEIVTEDGVEKVVPVMSFRELNGEGTADSPYLIATAADWEALSVNVYLGETYSDKFFLMTDDFSTDRMVGSSETNSFQGTFDGDGHTLTFTATTSGQVCAPFRWVKDATIKKLHTTGTITTSNNMAGGIAGRTYGTTVITNCISSMEISKTTSGDGSCGGLVSNVTGGTLTLTDCLFNGSLLGSSVTDNGGLVGWTNPAASVSVTNCLFAPTNVTMSTTSSYTLVRYNNNNATIINSYYRQTFGTVQGTSAIDMDNETLRMNLGEAWENIGGQVQPIFGIHSFAEGEGIEESPYLIASEDDWNRLASNAYLGETYYAEYFKMTADISVSRMVGTKTTGSNYFRGIFDGDGHTLTFTYTASVNDAAPFRYVSNATIKNLHVDGTIETSAGYAAGIAGVTYARTRIENCRSSIVIRSSHSGWSGHGGFVGLKPDWTNAHLTIEGCVFDGKILTTGATASTNCGGFVGFTNVATLTISNSLYAPAALETGETAVSNGATFYCNSTQIPSTIYFTNCYYTEPLGTAQGKLVHSITLDPTVVEDVIMAFAGNETEYNVSGITTCGIGIKYGDVFYAGNQDAVSLNFNVSPGKIIESVTYTPQVKGGEATTIVPDEADAYPFTMPNADVVINVDVIAGYTLDVAGYGDSEGGYVLIASPVGTVNPENVDNMLSNAYDLYRFNQEAELEWENYKAVDNGQPLHPDFTTLETGRGYLYANSADVTLVFPGEAYTGTGEVTLSKTGSGVFSGWNLVGNPFAETAYIADSRPFYMMNSDGSEIIAAEGNSIAPMEGVFVIANSNNEAMTFTTTEPESNGDAKLALNLTKDRGNVIDRAIVRFDEGQQLPKFQLNPSHSKLYIPQEGKEYAVVSRDAPWHVSTEIPVNFKAEKDGTYTFSINAEGVEVDNLHLIDNLTGADIDLLQTPSYTFTAKTTDYASRFRLVYAVGAASGDACEPGFAYVSNREIRLVETCQGASLQVIDMMGRVIVSRDDMHIVSTSGMTPGLYVLRLINGDEVKTQKIVIE